MMGDIDPLPSLDALVKYQTQLSIAANRVEVSLAPIRSVYQIQYTKMLVYSIQYTECCKVRPAKTNALQAF